MSKQPLGIDVNSFYKEKPPLFSCILSTKTKKQHSSRTCRVILFNLESSSHMKSIQRDLECPNINLWQLDKTNSSVKVTIGLTNSPRWTNIPCIRFKNI